MEPIKGKVYKAVRPFTTMHLFSKGELITYVGESPHSPPQEMWFVFENQLGLQQHLVIGEFAEMEDSE